MIYRIRFEVVRQGELHKYCDLQPAFYKNVQQVVPNSEIPDEEWEPVSRETTNLASIRSQYANLKRDADADRGFVRNPVVDCAEESSWRPVDDALLEEAG